MATINKMIKDPAKREQALKTVNRLKKNFPERCKGRSEWSIYVDSKMIASNVGQVKGKTKKGIKAGRNRSDYYGGI